MTREETTERLKMILAEATSHEDAVCYVTSNDADALEIAIKALEQEPCEDAISRQAVIEVLNKMDRYVADELTLCDTKRKFPKNEVFIVDDVYEEIVEQLPSVTPQQKTGRWIFVDKAKEYARCSKCGHGGVDLVNGRPHNFCPNCGAKMTESEE